LIFQEARGSALVQDVAIFLFKLGIPFAYCLQRSIALLLEIGMENS
jgi:hypothetical protein